MGGEISQNIYRLSRVDTEKKNKKKLFFINVLPKMTKCYERYMEKVTRKHTCQAPRQIIGLLGLWSPPGLSTRDAQFFFQAFLFKNRSKFYLNYILYLTNCCIYIVSLKIKFLWSHLCLDQNVLPGQCPVWTQQKTSCSWQLLTIVTPFYCCWIIKYA